MNIKSITHRNEINQYLLSLVDPKICEIGTRNGNFFNQIFTPNCQLGVIVDIWTDTGNIYENDNSYSQETLDSQYMGVFQRFFDYPNIKIIREFSHKAAKFFPDNFFDFVYVDADHSKSGCYRDLTSWYPKVKQGGIISGHDYISQEKTILYGHNAEFGVIEAVTQFLKENQIPSQQFHLTREEYATYFICKL